MSKLKIEDYRHKLRVPIDGSFDLSAVNPADTFQIGDKKKAGKDLVTIHQRLQVLQEKLYAQSEKALLIVLQAIDTGGKDSTIRRVFGTLNPQGVRVISFKVPSSKERSYDYLWRIHREVPPKGYIHIFNRSHYEDVLIVRVKQLASADQIEQRYDQINSFERYLTDNWVTILKFFLCISKDEQKRRLQDRLDRPDKHWKFSKDDLTERALWDDYMGAFDLALNRCSTSHAPWYCIPANHKWARDVLVGSIVLHTMEEMDLQFPEAEEGLDEIVIPD
jgi:PPK2 family polyphosphate:nucleotide phosphotransferase